MVFFGKILLRTFFPEEIFCLKLADINSIFDFRITNSQQIFSLPFPIGALCEDPIKVILKVTSPRLS